MSPKVEFNRSSPAVIELGYDVESGILEALAISEAASRVFGSRTLDRARARNSQTVFSELQRPGYGRGLVLLTGSDDRL